MKTVKYFIVCSFFIFLSCNQRPQNDTDVKEYLIPVGENGDILLSDIVGDYKIVPLETKENSLLGEIQKVELYDEKIFILSRNQIFVFEQNGKFIQKTNRTGRGPGEYIEIKDFDIFSETLFILDRTGQNVLEYDLKGRHINTRHISMWAQKLIVLNENEILIYSGEEDNSYNQCKFSVVNNNGEITGLIPIDERKSKFLHVNSTQNFIRHASNIYFHEAFNDVVYAIDNGRIEPIYHFVYDGLNIPDSFYDQSFDNIFSFFQEFNKTNYINGIYDLFWVDNNMFFKAYRNGNAQLFVVNTETGFLKTSNYLKNDVLLDDVEVPVGELSLGLSNDRLWFFMYPSELNENSSQITNPILKDLLEKISDESNPIMIITDMQKI